MTSPLAVLPVMAVRVVQKLILGIGPFHCLLVNRMPKFMLVQKGTRTWAGELFIFKHSFCGIELVRKLQSIHR